MKRVYDIVILGGGPAGIFAALYLTKHIKDRKIAIIDKKKYLGGAGARTDGKLNLSPDIGMDLDELMLKRQHAEEIIKIIEEQFLEIEPLEIWPIKEEVKEWQRKLEKYNMRLIPVKQIHMGTDRCYRVMNKFKEILENKGIDLFLGIEIEDIVKNEKLILVGKRDREEIEIETTFLIAAPGREGAYWFREIAEKLGINTRYGPIDIGLRIEFSAEVMKQINEVIYDPKIRYVTVSHQDRLRTFCTNPYGYVTIEEYSEFKLVNGHALYKKKSKNTNLAILQTIGLHEPFVDTTTYGKSIAKSVNLLGGNRPLLQRLGDLIRGRRSKLSRFWIYGNLEPTLNYGNGNAGMVTLGDISMIYPKRILENIMEFLKVLEKVFPGIMNPDTLVYAPEIKFYDTKYITSPYLETNIENIFVAGDGCGKSRGIVGAALTGILCAMGIIEKLTAKTHEYLFDPQKMKK